MRSHLQRADLIAASILAVLACGIGTVLGLAAADVRAKNGPQSGPLRMILRGGNEVRRSSATASGSSTRTRHPAGPGLDSVGGSALGGRRRGGSSRGCRDRRRRVRPRARRDARRRRTNRRRRVAVIDPATSRVVDEVHVGRTPTIVAAATAGLGAEQGRRHADAPRRALARVVQTVELDVTASDLAIGEGGVWVAAARARHHRPAGVREARAPRPRTGAIDREFDTQTGASVLAAGGHALWTTGS